MRKILIFSGGVATTLAGQAAYKWYCPRQKINQSRQTLVDAYIKENNLVEHLPINLLANFMRASGAFLDHGILHRLKGFHYFKNYFEKDQIDRDQISHFHCIFSPTRKVCGHPSIQHGGASATLVDQACGITSMLHAKKLVATCELSVKYVLPIKEGKMYILKGEVISKIEREIRLKATIHDLQTKELVLTSDSLFKTVDWDHKMASVFKLLFNRGDLVPAITNNIKGQKMVVATQNTQPVVSSNLLDELIHVFPTEKMEGANISKEPIIDVTNLEQPVLAER